MTQVSATARRYAKALYQIASENPRAKAENTLSDTVKLRDDLADVSAELSESLGQDVLELLTGRQIDVETKHELFEKLINESKYQKMVVNFYGVLIDHHRLDLIDEVIAGLETEINLAQNRIKALVKTARPLTDGQRDALVEKLKAHTGKDVVLEIEEHPDLIGGVRIEVAGKVYDYSLQAQLNRLSAQLER